MAFIGHEESVTRSIKYFSGEECESEMSLRSLVSARELAAEVEKLRLRLKVAIAHEAAVDAWLKKIPSSPPASLKWEQGFRNGYEQAQIDCAWAVDDARRDAESSDV